MVEEEESYRLARSTSYLLLRAVQAASERFAKRAHALSLRQFLVLAAIAEQPGASQNDLVRATSVDRSTLADMLKKLAAHGLVKKAASQTDARANAVELTPLGKKSLQAAYEDARKADQAVLDALPKSKRKGFQDMLERLAKRLDLAAEKAEKEERRRRRREARKLRRLAEKAEKAALKALSASKTT